MYEPSAPPSSPQEFARWAADEFARIARLFGDGHRIHFVQPSYAAPDRPREGMLVHADGTTWDPGSGAGTYAYIGGSWVYLPGGGGSASDSFATIAVSGQSNVVADSSSDTLTLAAGSNITITTNAGTDTVTIAAASGSPAGADTQVQFNDGGAFGANAQFTYAKATYTITLGNTNGVNGVITGPTGATNGVDLTVKGGDGPSGSTSGTLYLKGGTTSAGIGSVGGDVRLDGGDGAAGVGQGGSIRFNPGTGLLRGQVFSNGAGSALATNANGGFFHLPTCAGTPTGTPSVTLAGNAPIIADTTNNRIWAYLNSAWRGIGLATTVNPQESMQIACSDETTALTTGTAKVTFRNPYNVAITIDSVRASLTTAQASGSIFTVDINESGTTILSTKLTIDNTEKTSVSAAAAAVISDASIAANAEMTIDIDQVGDGTAAGLKVVIEYHR